MHFGRDALKIRHIFAFGNALLHEMFLRADQCFKLFKSLYCQQNISGYLFIAINGAGLGHLTRCLAIARKLREQAPNERIIFVTTSIAVPLVHQAGFLCHHIPPFALIGNEISARRWNDLFYENLVSALRLHRPSTLIFDGSVPYPGLLRAMRKFNRLNYVWIKRGLYKSSVNTDKLLSHTKRFDLTICPGELDGSASSKDEPSIKTVNPVLLLDESEILDRDFARRMLDLHDKVPAVYVQLGAGNINSIVELQNKVAKALKKAGVQVVLAQSPIALDRSTHSEADNVIIDFPNTKYYKAFDFAVLAGGYNSVNEAVLLRLPAIFIPNMQTGADDQLRRCLSAKAFGDYEVLEHFEEGRFLRIAEYLIARKRRSEAIEPRFRNGALEAAELIINLDNSK